MLKVCSLLFSFASLGLAADQIPLAPELPPNFNDGQLQARPNIVFILTDDQDKHMNSLEYMPLLKKYITDHGTTYDRHYCSTAICCPSRVTLWTGKYSHNTNVTDVGLPHGGYPKFVSQGLNHNYLPVWLQKAGYNTFYTGKLFNAHSVENYDSPFPAGWTASDFLLDPYTYRYWNSVFQRNQEPPVSYEGYYSTDVMAQKAYGLLEEAVTLGDPFFLTIATNAPHSDISRDFSHGRSPLMTEPVPAKRHEHLFPDVKVPWTPNFNPEKQTGASWTKDLPILNQTELDYNDHFYRQRLRALQAVDEIVEGIVTRLDDYGILNNTYIVYSTDNGYHIGQHRLKPGKECGFEEDINIPLIIRGPGVPEGKTSSIVTAHTDLAPTFFNIAGIDLRSDFDGSPIPLTEEGLNSAILTRQEHINVEFWGIAIPEGNYGTAVDNFNLVNIYPNNTYKALRIHGQDYDLYYSVWCNNEHELYDMVSDPYQTTNIYSAVTQYPSPKSSVVSLSWSKVVERLDALLMVTKSCKGNSCVRPWSVIHPQGDVSSLKDALNPKFDLFYASQSRSNVRFDKCELGYIIESEGPQHAIVFGMENDEL